MLFVTCHDIYSKILSKLTKSVPKCLIYTHCFRARSLFIFGNLFFWTGMLHSSSSMSSYSISFSRTNRSSSIYLTPLPFSSTNARNLVEWAYTRYQVKPPYISTKCTMHALPWLIYCPLPKKTTITTTAKDTHRSQPVCSWTHFIKPKGVLGNDMNLTMMLGLYQQMLL